MSRMHVFRPSPAATTPEWSAAKGRAERRHAALRCEPLADGRRDPDDPPTPPVGRGRLEPNQRLAQIAHARSLRFQPWEIAQLVPGPATEDEQRAWWGEVT